MKAVPGDLQEALRVRIVARCVAVIIAKTCIFRVFVLYRSGGFGVSLSTLSIREVHRQPFNPRPSAVVQLVTFVRLRAPRIAGRRLVGDNHVVSPGISRIARRTGYGVDCRGGKIDARQRAGADA